MSPSLQPSRMAIRTKGASLSFEHRNLETDDISGDRHYKSNPVLKYTHDVRATATEMDEVVHLLSRSRHEND